MNKHILCVNKLCFHFYSMLIDVSFRVVTRDVNGQIFIPELCTRVQRPKRTHFYQKTGRHRKKC